MRYTKDHTNLQYARHLRKNMTPQERHLWYDFLRYCKPRFRRQERIGNYIADFFCHQARLVIEIDGSGHYEPEAVMKDAERTAYFETFGIKVIRFSNADVNVRFQNVCEAILLALAQRGSDPSVNFDNEAE